MDHPVDEYNQDTKVQIQEEILPKIENLSNAMPEISSEIKVNGEKKKVKKKKVIKDGTKMKKGRPRKDVIVQKHLKKNLAMCKLCGIEVHGLITHHRCYRITCRVSLDSDFLRNDFFKVLQQGYEFPVLSTSKSFVTSSFVEVGLFVCTCSHQRLPSPNSTIPVD